MSICYIQTVMIREFHHTDFAPLNDLVLHKKNLGNRISLVIPALNEALTIGPIVKCAVSELSVDIPLLDEVLVVDGGSTDDTCRIAADNGAMVVKADDIDPSRPSLRGKGTSLRKALSVAKGDIVVFIDADITNFGPRFIYGLIGPLLYHEHIGFVKAFYQRPLLLDDHTIDNYGGRVTEIMVRPFLCAFFPLLAHLHQPLSGEYAIRRSILSKLAFSSGYGVEIGLVIDIFRMYGLSVFAQVDMDRRFHRNRPLGDLSRMSFGILQTMLRKLENERRLSLMEEPSRRFIGFSDGKWNETTIDEIDLSCIDK